MTMTQGTEAVTAYTNLMICILALVFALLTKNKKGMFFSLAAAGLVGFLAHGFTAFGVDRAIYPYVWMVVTAVMSVASLWPLAIVADRRITKIAIGVGLAAWLIYDLLFLFVEEYFIITIAFDGVCLAASALLALLKRPRKWRLFAANLLVIGGGLLQAVVPRDVNLVWLFNCSGMAHIMILIALPFYFLSVKREIGRC